MFTSSNRRSSNERASCSSYHSARYVACTPHAGRALWRMRLRPLPASPWKPEPQPRQRIRWTSGYDRRPCEPPPAVWAVRRCSRIAWTRSNRAGSIGASKLAGFSSWSGLPLWRIARPAYSGLVRISVSPASARPSSSARFVSLQAPVAYSSKARRTRSRSGSLDRSQQLALPYSGEAERRMASRVAIEAPLLGVAVADVSRQAPDVRGIGHGLEPFELVRVDVAADQPVGAEDDDDPAPSELLAVGPGVGDVAREPARVVAEENLEGAGLSVREHPGEVGPPERVLARHEIDVLAPRRAQPVALGERSPARRAGSRGRIGPPGRVSTRGCSPPKSCL